MKISLLFLVTVLSSRTCLAQGARAAFDIASIRPSKADEPWFWDITEDGRMLARNVTLKDLLMLAYRLQEFQILGGPGWVSKSQFDIQAKLEDGHATDEQSRYMMRNLLEERFHLSLHKETRTGPVYLLEVVKNGPHRSADQSPPTTPNGPQPDPNHRGAMRMGSGVASGVGLPISLLVRFLSQTVGRPVIDKTELVGRYDIDLHWAPDVMSHEMPGTPVPRTDQPSLFAALQEQVGLKLVSAIGQVDRLIIDRAERPIEN